MSEKIDPGKTPEIKDFNANFQEGAESIDKMPIDAETKKIMKQQLFNAINTNIDDSQGSSQEVVNVAVKSSEKQGEVVEEEVNQQKEGQFSEKMSKINVISKNKERGNIVEIAGKTFSFLRPTINNEDIFGGPEGTGYEHERYIKGEVIEKYLGNKQIFAGKEDFEEFIKKNIPGKTRNERIEFFADLMGLELSGYYHSDGTFNYLPGVGYAWISRSDGNNAYELRRTSGNADAGLNNHKYAQQVIVFED